MHWVKSSSFDLRNAGDQGDDRADQDQRRENAEKDRSLAKRARQALFKSERFADANRPSRAASTPIASIAAPNRPTAKRYFA